jgi:hypothetical protein
VRTPTKNERRGGRTYVTPVTFRPNRSYTTLRDMTKLRAIVEFLNAQMSTTEVLAVEIRQYVTHDGAHQTLVPRLIGQTAAARQAKGAASTRHWTRKSGWLCFGSAEALATWQPPRHCSVGPRIDRRP